MFLVAVEVINPQDQARIDLAIQRSMQTYEEEMSARREDEAKLLKAIEASRKEEALRLEAAGNAAQKENQIYYAPLHYQKLLQKMQPE